MSKILCTRPLPVHHALFYNRKMSKRIVLLQALAATPADLRRLLTHPVPNAVPQPPPGTWTSQEVVQHLLDVEARYRERLERIVVEETPPVPLIQPPQAGYGDGAGLPDLIEAFAHARAETLDFLKGLPSGAWQRRAIHPSWGERTLRVFVQRLVDHDTEHLNQLAALKQRGAPAIDRRAPEKKPVTDNQLPTTEGTP